MSVKKHYWTMIVICLIMAMLSIAYSSSLSSVKTNLLSKDESSSIKIYNKLLGLQLYQDKEQQESEGLRFTVENKLDKQNDTNTSTDRKLGIISVEHSRGVLAKLTNSITSKNIMRNLYNAMNSINTSENVITTILIILALLWVLFESFFFINVIEVICKRYFLEARLYQSVPTSRFFFLIRIRRWLNVIKIMLRRDVTVLLWYLTIIGGIIKSYSYKLVPYIAAENPNLSSKEVLDLSERMMKGHKWEAFVLELSFIPWFILGGVTCGLSSIFYSNAYQEATAGEYYAFLRSLAKQNQIPGAELLNDTYLYEKAEPALLKEKYSDITELVNDIRTTKEISTKKQPISRFFKNIFGVILIYNEEERVYEYIQANKDRLFNYTETLDGNMYPARLFPLPSKDKVRQMSSIHYNRNYQLTSIILMFFFMCIIGWAWEVSLHLISDGEFVNRGVLHGPWLPIYGAGCILILMLLNKFRTNPIAEFIAAVVLCGTLEYFSGYFLEITHNGEKWWDYTGYFLNIHGRVCAEGLLVFGLGGLAFVYLIAPFLDNMFRCIKFKMAAIVCALLVLCFSGDQIYSIKHPNKGPGVTDYQAPAVSSPNETETPDADVPSETEKKLQEEKSNA